MTATASRKTPARGLLSIDSDSCAGGNVWDEHSQRLGWRVIKIAAGLGQMLGNVVIIGRADPVEQQSARALSLVSIAHTRVSHV